ncbi:MAG TPA: hypothetical protein VGL95_04475 [Acetobacteraceae bacterium]
MTEAPRATTVTVPVMAGAEAAQAEAAATEAAAAARAAVTTPKAAR